MDSEIKLDDALHGNIYFNRSGDMLFDICDVIREKSFQLGWGMASFSFTMSPGAPRSRFTEALVYLSLVTLP